MKLKRIMDMPSTSCVPRHDFNGLLTIDDAIQQLGRRFSVNLELIRTGWPK